MSGPSRGLGPGIGVFGAALVILSTLLDFLTGSGTEFGDLALGGAGAVALTLAAWSLTRGIPERLIVAIGLLTLLFGDYLVRSIAFADSSGIRHSSQILVSISVLLFAAQVRLTPKSRFALAMLSWAGALVVFVLMLGRLHEIRTYEVAEKNVWGGVLFYLLLIGGAVSNRVWANYVGAIIAATVGLLIGQRLLPLLSLVLVLSMLMGMITRRDRWMWAIFGMVVLGLVFLVITYSGPVAEYIYGPLSEWVRLYTGRGIFTGRQEIWPLVLAEIAKAPVWGHGPGVLPSDFMPLRLSAHNYYLQLALQVGFTGVALLMAALASLYHVALKVRRDGAGLAGALAPAVVLVLMVHQGFEVTLLQNALVIGALQWLLLGLLLGRTWRLGGPGEGSTPAMGHDHSSTGALMSTGVTVSRAPNATAP